MLRRTFVRLRRLIVSPLFSVLLALSMSTSACVKAKISASKKAASLSLEDSATLSFTAPAALSWANIANVASVTVSGTCSSSLEGQSVLLRAAGPASALATCTSGLFSTSMDFTAVAQGAFTLTADATDTSGNAATQATLSLQKDTVAPTVAFTSPAASAYVQNSLVLSGTCSDNGQTVNLAGTGSLTGSATCTAGAWNATIDITSVADGAISWTADISDAAGNPATQATRGFIKDLSVPTVAITSPAAGAYINIANKAAFTVSGTCSESGRTVSIAAGAVTATPSCTGGNTWTTTLDLTALSDGTVTVTADHNNAASIAATQASRAFNKDTVAPTVALTAPLASVKIVTSNQSAFTISGTCSEVGQNVVISGDASATVSCVAGNTWSYSADVSSKADGVISFSADHSDAAGNPATQSSRNYTKDTTAPAAFTITGVTGGADVTADAYLLDNTTAVIGWNDTTGEDSYDVVIKKASDNSVMCTLVNKAADSTSHDFSACTLTYGQDYKAVVIAKDNDGNEREATNSPYTFKVNRVPTATNDTIFVAKNASATTLSVLTNDTDPDSDTLTISSIDTTGTSGSVTNNTTSLSYTPTASYTGADTFTYSITDSRGGTSTATVTIKVMDQFTWTGANGSVNWAQSGNWCGTVTAGACAGGAAPNSTQIAIFDGTCSSNCSPTIAANMTVGGVRMNSGYNGTITQGTGFTVAVGSNGWTQAAGTFTGSASNVTISGAFNLTGGTFTATSATTTVTTGSITIGASATFNHSSGMFTWNAGGSCIAYTGSFGSHTLNNLTLTTTCGSYTVTGTINVEGTLTTSGSNLTVNTGTISVAGNVTINGTGNGGTGKVKLVGSSAQTVTGSASAYMPSFEIASSDTVTLVGTVGVFRDFTITSGTLDAGTSTVKIRGNGCGTNTINLGGQSLYDLTLDGDCTYYTVTGTLPVTHNLTLGGASSNRLNTGTVTVEGDVTVSQWLGGSGKVKLVGSGAQTVTGSASAYMPNFEIASSGTVTLAGNVGVGGNLTYTSGTLDAGTSTLTWNGYNGCATFTASLGSQSLYDLALVASCAHFSVSGTLNVARNFTHSGSTSDILTGTIEVGGNVTVNNGNGGSGKVKLVGTGAQTITGSSSAYLPNLEFASSNTVTLAGNVGVLGNITHTSGTLDAGTSTLTWNGINGCSTFTASLGSQSLYDLNFIASCANFAITGTMKVARNVSFGASGSTYLASGTLEVGGDIAVSSWRRGDGIVKLVGTGTQTITGTAGAYISNVTFASSGTVNLSGNVGMHGNITHTSGTVDAGTSTVTWQGANICTSYTVSAAAISFYNFTMTGSTACSNINLGANMTVTNTLTMGGYQITKNGHTLTVGGSAVGTGSMFGGTVNP